MTAHTSKQAYLDLLPQLGQKQKVAYAAVTAHPKKTARELELITGNPDLHKRISELKAMGLVKPLYAGARCSVTGAMTARWQAMAVQVRPPKPKPTRSELVALLNRAASALSVVDGHEARVVEHLIRKALTP